MLDNNEGQLFFPGEDWRMEAKKKAHTLSQKYNTLTEYEPEERRKVLTEILGDCSVL